MINWKLLFFIYFLLNAKYCMYSRSFLPKTVVVHSFFFPCTSGLGNRQCKQVFSGKFVCGHKLCKLTYRASWIGCKITFFFKEPGGLTQIYKNPLQQLSLSSGWITFLNVNLEIAKWPVIPNAKIILSLDTIFDTDQWVNQDFF